MNAHDDWLKPGAMVSFPMGVFRQWPPKVEQWHGVVMAVHGEQVSVSYDQPGAKTVQTVMRRDQLQPSS